MCGCHRLILYVLGSIGLSVYMAGSSGMEYPSYQSLRIPPGHLPPPGSCRIWYPGKPPGHQPPPQSCESAFRKAPPNAWVITRKDHNHELLEVHETGANKVIIDIKFYTID